MLESGLTPRQQRLRGPGLRKHSGHTQGYLGHQSCERDRRDDGVEALDFGRELVDGLR